MRNPRLLTVLVLAAAVAAVLLGMKLRFLAAGGKAVLVLGVIAALLLLAMRPRRADRGRADQRTAR